MGHGYGLDHSRQDGSAADYMDRWDTMSTWDSCFMAPHQDYVLIGPGLNAANMAGRGWLDGQRVWSSGSTSFSTTIQLRPLHRRDLPGFLAARLGVYGSCRQFRLLLSQLPCRIWRVKNNEEATSTEVADAAQEWGGV